MKTLQICATVGSIIMTQQYGCHVQEDSSAISCSLVRLLHVALREGRYRASGFIEHQAEVLPYIRPARRRKVYDIVSRISRFQIRATISSLIIYQLRSDTSCVLRQAYRRTTGLYSIRNAASNDKHQLWPAYDCIDRYARIQMLQGFLGRQNRREFVQNASRHRQHQEQ